MIRRRSTISIYDYPEHLNPFREERRESIGNKFRSFGQRGSSFRNAWNLLLPRSKRSQSFSRASTSSPQPGLYDTWSASRASRTQHEAIGLPASWTISPRRKYTPPNSLAGSPPRSPSARGSQISVATLGTDLPSPDDRFHWQGARPKKRRAPLPPTSPTGSNVTSSHTSSNASLHDAIHYEDTKVGERESLQILVSRIQQEFGEGSSLSRHDQKDDREETKSEDSVEGTTTSGSCRIDRSNIQVEKAFVIEPPSPPYDDTPSDNNSVGNEKEATVNTGPGDVAKIDRDTKQDGGEEDGLSREVTEDDSAIDEPKEVAIQTPQVTTNVFVETTSKTISSDGKITITTSDEVKTPNACGELGSGEQTREISSIVTHLPGNEDDSNKSYQTTDSRNHSSQSETDSLVSGVAEKDLSSETSAGECQVETVPVRYECGAFVVSTPDTASVYEDAASEEDVEGPEAKTPINGFHKSSPKEDNSSDSSKRVVDANIKSVSYVVPVHTKNDVCHTKLSLKTFSNDVIPINTTPSNDLGTKTSATVIPDNTSKTCTSDPQKLLTDASNTEAPIHTMPSGTLKYHTSVSVTLLKEDKGSMEATPGNTSPIIPLKYIGARANGDILRTPQTVPRYKPANGRSEQTSSIAEAVSPAGSPTNTPTPPPRIKPQPVPRIKRLKKLFSNH